MKTMILKLSAFVLIFTLMGAGCEKKENTASDTNVPIKDVSAEVANNDWQNLPTEELIWYFKVDEKVMLKIQPYRDNYLIPVKLQDNFKIKGLKIQITGNILLNKLSAISKSYPPIKLASSYKFEITEIKKGN